MVRLRRGEQSSATPGPGGRGERPARGGFTLIEVLVVVAIIALLIAVLLPTLKLAKEYSRASVCLSHLKQQGIAFSAYSADHKSVLPWAGSFRFSLMEGKYYLGYTTEERHDWAVVNIGLLYPKYIGDASPEVFYCPNNRATDARGTNGIEQFRRCYRAPRHDQPGYQNAHTFPISPFSSFNYAAPLLPAYSPRDAGSEMYPEESVRYGEGAGTESPYWQYLTTAADPDPSFLGPFPRETRGKHNVHAFVTDGYFAGKESFQWEGKIYNREPYEGYHLKSYNVLYGDFHARRVVDPKGQVHAAQLHPVRYTGSGSENAAKVFKVWDYFSRNP